MFTAHFAVSWPWFVKRENLSTYVINKLLHGWLSWMTFTHFMWRMNPHLFFLHVFFTTREEKSYTLTNHLFFYTSLWKIPTYPRTWWWSFGTWYSGRLPTCLTGLGVIITGSTTCFISNHSPTSRKWLRLGSFRSWHWKAASWTNTRLKSKQMARSRLAWTPKQCWTEGISTLAKKWHYTDKKKTYKYLVSF